MSVGRGFSKTEIDARAGDIAIAFQKVFGDVATLKSFLDGTPDADLVALGYTSNEVATLKTAISKDAFQVGQIFAGLDAQPTPYDFRTFLWRLLGVGSF